MNHVHGALVDRYCLTKPGSSKQTWHVEIEFSGSRLQFRPGDSLGVLPKNPWRAVEALLDYFRISSETPFCDPRTGCTVPVAQWLRCGVEINRVSEKMAAHFGCGDRADYDGYDVLSFLQVFGSADVSFTDIAHLFVPMRPRLYSIASGPSMNGHRVDLTVTQVHFEVNGRSCYGVCSRYLTQEAPLGIPEMELFLQPTSHFIFPEDARTPVVMIGPGTGVAPFRAFLQEMEAGSVPKLPCWLFFGERHRATDFLYEDFWSKHVALGHLRLDVAFSRDQEQKCYVHHRMWEHRSELWQWLANSARIYVCGDATHMARDVDRCLINIASDQGGLSEMDALHFTRKLRAEGRYLRDIYS